MKPDHAANGFDVSFALEKIRRAKEEVNERLVDREEVVDQIFYALITREHALVQSRTGAAKSLLARQIFAMFEGARLFQVQASKEQQPDTYFGALDIEELKKGRVVHNTRGSLVDAEFGFIDEIFDANDYTLRALLTTLNERALVLGAQVVPAPLHTVIAATNYLRISEVTEAVLDRFVYKSVIHPSKEPAAQYLIARRYLRHGGQPAPPRETVPFTLLDRVSRIVTGNDPRLTVRVPAEVVFLANIAVKYFETARNRRIKERPQDHPYTKDGYISPRTYAKGLDTLRASAFLDGRTEVTADDIVNLRYLHTIVGLKDQEELFRKSVETVLRHYTTAGAWDQLRTLLAFQELLDSLRTQPEMLSQPVTLLEEFPFRRNLLEWVKDKLGLERGGIAVNRRLFESFIESIEPKTEEILDLKRRQEMEIAKLFRAATED
ncbi:MAG: AAA family ATPase [Bacteroidota bacterium]|nr:AAA family ATPase [Bacteroidota bacterium]